MTAFPPFRYTLSGEPDPVTPEDPRWKRPLPLERMNAGDRGPGVTYGDYFTAARTFLSREGFAPLRAALGGAGERVDVDAVREVVIGLEKHGALYHPSRVRLDIGACEVSFVLNVAVSVEGRQSIRNEFDQLRRLADPFAGREIPAVYARGSVPSAAGQELEMFLGQWFDGFHEFHVAERTAAGRTPIRVWDPAGTVGILTGPQTATLYRKATRLLTRLFNVETLEQVYPWHHAAGDFVVRTHGGGIDIKLITVRGYVPLLPAETVTDHRGDLGFLAQALMLFFLQTSIRMRLDRIDGTGTLVWTGDAAVEPTLAGLLDALTEKPPCDVSLDRLFRMHAATYDTDDLFELCSALARRYPPAAVECAVVSGQMAEHAAAVYRAIHGAPAPQDNDALVTANAR